ncbi:Altered inheritance of mitochondria protein 11 [Fusarium sp. LHS14.1]|nr:Altered inheritance of mitochondria protein 11 [Fusarium sp. LHS14.1]
MPGTASTPVAQVHQATAAPAEVPSTSQPWTRPLKQFGLFFAGAGFMAASIAISRRSVLRRRLDSLPKFYSSNRQTVKFDSADRSLLAVQALGLATLNVISFAVLLVGGISWGFDLSSVQELRERSQAAIRRPGLVNPEDEKEMEKMMEDLMARLGMDKPAPSEKPSSDSNKD